MTDTSHDAAKVIQSYRRRRERMVPLILGGLAVVLSVVGIFLIFIWVSADGGPNIANVFAKDTPTPALTNTPPPPTVTSTITLTPLPSETPTPEWPKTYIVELGDTLWTVAEDFGVAIELIIAFNDIPDPNNVPIGVELTIPEPDSEVPTATPLPDDLVTGDKILYTVQAGDNLEVIAATFFTTVEAIADENEIEDTNNIGIGTILTISIGPTPTPGPETPTATSSS